MESQKEPEAVWAVVEQMDHQQVAGRLSEEEKFGGKIGRVDVPLPDGTFATQFFRAASVFRIRIVTEAVARAAAQHSTTAPVDDDTDLCSEEGCTNTASQSCIRDRCSICCRHCCGSECPAPRF